MLKNLRHRMIVFLAVFGPGFITAVADNDAGGIFMYSEAGARWGYLLLWTMLPVMLVLIVTQVMCARMGAVTGKGLSDLIREEFGLRATFLVMVALLLVNLTNVTANFAGIAGSLDLFGVSRYLSVPLGAVLVWVLVVKGTYRSVEKIFLVASSFYLAYVISAVIVKPDWSLAFESSVTPVIAFDGPYLAILVGLVGTSVAPWMQFYLQAAIVEKGVDVKQFTESKIEVIVGCVVMAFIKFFVIVACAGAIWSHGPGPSKMLPRRRWPCNPSAPMPTSFSVRAYSMPPFSPRPFSPCRRPIRFARGWVLNPASITVSKRRPFSIGSTLS